MWTTSNSHGKCGLASRAVLLAMLLAFGYRVLASDLPPDAPRSAPAPQEQTEPRERRPADPDTTRHPRLVAVTVKTAEDLPAGVMPGTIPGGDPALVAIEVETNLPLDASPRSSSPVLVVNGERLDETYVDPDDGRKVIGLIEAARLRAQDNRVEIDWIGISPSPFAAQSLEFAAPDAADSPDQ